MQEQRNTKFEKASVFILEDSKTLCDMMRESFIEHGYNVTSAGTVSKFRQIFVETKPDLFLLDLILPDGDGLSLIKEIRNHTDAPVIVISGKNEMVDKVVGLEMGADDYVGKPIEMKEILARVKAHIRRYRVMKEGANDHDGSSHKAPATKIKFDKWILNRHKFQAFDGNGASANLTAKEYRLLETLVLGEGRVFSREQLLDIARDGDHNTTDRAVDVQIMRIRKKLSRNAASSEIIESIRGVGYMLAVKTEIVE